MQQPITQQLQRTQQLCTNAMNLCQQVVQELNLIHQAVQSSSYAQPAYTSQTQGYGQSSGGYGYTGNVSSVMNADRGYGTSMQGEAQQYSAGMQGAGSGVQSVMQADQYGQQENSYGSRGAMTQGGQSYQTQSMSSGSYGSHAMTGGVSTVMQADRNYGATGSGATSNARSYGSGYGSGAGSMSQNSGYTTAGVSSVMQADRYNQAY